MDDSSDDEDDDDKPKKIAAASGDEGQTTEDQGESDEDWNRYPERYKSWMIQNIIEMSHLPLSFW